MIAVSSVFLGASWRWLIVAVMVLDTTGNRWPVAGFEASTAAGTTAFVAQRHDVTNGHDSTARATKLVVSGSTDHLTFTVRSHEVITPGTSMSVLVDVVPNNGIHVYAPGSQYRPFAVSIRSDPFLRVRRSTYSKPTLYVFKPLNEKVSVYSSPFRVVLDVTTGDNSTRQAQLRERSQLTVTAGLEYQACDDTVCYLPMSIIVEWTARVSR
jgi:hypothetical protein